MKQQDDRRPPRAVSIDWPEKAKLRQFHLTPFKRVRRPRAEVGWSCAISCQEKVLRTRPWQPVPAADYVAVTDRDDEGSPIMGRAAAAELLRRLLAAGLSRYEPDPLRALARIEAERGI